MSNSLTVLSEKRELSAPAKDAETVKIELLAAVQQISSNKFENHSDAKPAVTQEYYTNLNNSEDIEHVFHSNESIGNLSGRMVFGLADIWVRDQKPDCLSGSSSSELRGFGITG